MVDSGVIATQSSFWKDKIWVTAGIRRDRVTNNTATALRDPITQEYTGLSWDRPDDLSAGDTTSSTGVAYHVMPWLTLYGNRSDNFNTQGNAVLFGETGSNSIAGNTKGKGQDIGIRSRLLDGRINFSLGYYSTKQVGQYFFVAGTYTGAVNNIWTALGQNRPLLTGNDLQDVSGEGIEFELTANPTRNLRLTFNYSKANQFGQTRNYTTVVLYLEANRALWLSPENAVRPTVNTFGSTVQATWDTIQHQLAIDTQTNGRQPFAFRPESANAFARYDFRQGFLKGFAVGGGVNWRGPMVIAYRQNDASQPVKGYAQLFVNGLLSYEYRLTKKLSASVQLNVDNLLNFDDPYPRRAYWFDDTQSASVLYQYPYQVRRWSVSSTIRF
jgi:outer membrane receptor for ferric coprogen and ferric-rhodotorulic acid